MSPSPSRHSEAADGDGGGASPERPLSSRGGRDYNESPPATQYIRSPKAMSEEFKFQSESEDEP